MKKRSVALLLVLSLVSGMLVTGPVATLAEESIAVESGESTLYEESSEYLEEADNESGSFAEVEESSLQIEAILAGEGVGTTESEEETVISYGFQGGTVSILMTTPSSISTKGLISFAGEERYYNTINGELDTGVKNIFAFDVTGSGAANISQDSTFPHLHLYSNALLTNEVENALTFETLSDPVAGGKKNVSVSIAANTLTPEYTYYLVADAGFESNSGRVTGTDIVFAFTTAAVSETETEESTEAAPVYGFQGGTVQILMTEPSSVSTRGLISFAGADRYYNAINEELDAGVENVFAFDVTGPGANNITQNGTFPHLHLYSDEQLSSEMENALTFREIVSAVAGGKKNVSVSIAADTLTPEHTYYLVADANFESNGGRVTGTDIVFAFTTKAAPVYEFQGVGIFVKMTTPSAVSTKGLIEFAGAERYFNKIDDKLDADAKNVFSFDVGGSGSNHVSEETTFPYLHLYSDEQLTSELENALTYEEIVSGVAGGKKNVSVSIASGTLAYGATYYLVVESGFNSRGTAVGKDLVFAFTTEAASDAVNKASLEAAIAEAESYQEDGYTPESWAVLAEALEAAKIVAANEDATQEEVNQADAALNAAMDALVVQYPEEAGNWTPYVSCQGNAEGRAAVFMVEPEYINILTQGKINLKGEVLYYNKIVPKYDASEAITFSFDVSGDGSSNAVTLSGTAAHVSIYRDSDFTEENLVGTFDGSSDDLMAEILGVRYYLSHEIPEGVTVSCDSRNGRQVAVNVAEDILEPGMVYYLVFQEDFMVRYPLGNKLVFVFQTMTDFSELQAALRETESIDPAGCTEDSLVSYQNALAEAENVAAKEDASQEEIDAAAAALEEAILGLNKVEISDALVITDELKAAGRDTVEKIQEVLLNAVADSGYPEDNFVVYEVTVSVYRDGEWVEAGDEDLPENGVSVVLPYPDGIDGNGYDFLVKHMLAHGENAGNVEELSAVKDTNGLKITLSNLSPVAVSWQIAEEPATEEPSTEEPATEEPSTEAPTTEEPGTEAPTTEEPGTEVPSTAAPTTAAPTTAAPTTAADKTGVGTGDTVDMFRWISLLCLCGVVMVGALAASKRSKKHE